MVAHRMTTTRAMRPNQARRTTIMRVAAPSVTRTRREPVPAIVTNQTTTVDVNKAAVSATRRNSWTRTGSVTLTTSISCEARLNEERCVRVLRVPSSKPKRAPRQLHALVRRHTLSRITVSRSHRSSYATYEYRDRYRDQEGHPRRRAEAHWDNTSDSKCGSPSRDG